MSQQSKPYYQQMLIYLRRRVKASSNISVFPEVYLAKHNHFLMSAEPAGLFITWQRDFFSRSLLISGRRDAKK